MRQLVFKDEDRLFVGDCVQFTGYDGDEPIKCGVTTYALKHHHPELPVDGLLPAELFLKAFDDLIVKIHAAARRKYIAGGFEPDSAIKVMVHDTDLR
jgi:hypothetical protein